jgi:predicted transcriptional regulator
MSKTSPSVGRTIFLPKEIDEALQQVAEESGQSVNDLIENACRHQISEFCADHPEMEDPSA